jgi:hypothetical protein
MHKLRSLITSGIAYLKSIGSSPPQITDPLPYVYKDEEEDDYEEVVVKEVTEDDVYGEFINYAKDKNNIMENLWMGGESRYSIFFMIFKKIPLIFFEFLREHYPPHVDKIKRDVIKKILKNIIISIARSGEENYTYFDYIIHYFYSETHTFYYPRHKIIGPGEYVYLEGLNNLSGREVLFNFFKEIIKYHRFIQTNINYPLPPGGRALFYSGQLESECREMHGKNATLYHKIFFDIIIPGYVTCFLSYETGVDPAILCLDKCGVKLELDVVKDIAEYFGLNYKARLEFVKQSINTQESLDLIIPKY